MLDADTCYRAMVSRDRRFDGRFIIGVRTTGIYCRPGCPARTPLRKSVTFFACAAAAEQFGLRPCLRCRPDASAGTAAANMLGTPATVNRALRLIRQGALDGEGNVEALAGRLGISGRHLRGLFEEHLGCSPVAVAQSARVHLARKLIEETPLPMTEVAQAAGFGSVRRFNDALRTVFRQPPSGLRKNPPARAVGEPLRLRLPFVPPLDWPALLAFLRARAIAGVERVDADGYRRTFVAEGVAGALDVSRGGPEHLVMALHLPRPVELMPIVARVRRLFDLDADPRRVAAQLRADRRSPAGKAMAARVRRWPGLRVPGAWDGFELAVRAILGQQISVKAATGLAAQLVTRWGTCLGSPLGLTHLFPSPAQLADAPLTGMPKARGRAINELGRAVAAGLQLDDWIDADAATTALTALPGIGPWTAQYIAMRMGQPDAFPAGDLVLRKHAGGAVPLTEKQLLAQAEAWRPFRAYAAVHLWTHDKPAKETS